MNGGLVSVVAFMLAVAAVFGVLWWEDYHADHPHRLCREHRRRLRAHRRRLDRHLRDQTRDLPRMGKALNRPDRKDLRP